MTPPKKNSEHRIAIKSVTSLGFGVGGVGGFVVFVDGLLAGDEAVVRIVRPKKSYAYGKTVRLLSPSPDRVDSPCPVAGRCGGCQFMHAAYGAQLAYKKRFVADALERIGGVPDPPVDDVVPMDFDSIGAGNLRYRNKGVFPIAPYKNGDGFAIGMFAPRSHRLVEVSDCLIQREPHIGALRAIREHMRGRKIPAYDEAAHRGLMRHVMLRFSEHTGEAMAVLVANGPKIPGEGRLADRLADCGVTAVVADANEQKGNAIFGGNFRPLLGDGHITEAVCGAQYRIGPLSFFQVNTRQAEKLYAIAIGQAGLDGSGAVADAHCGAGGVLLLAAPRAEKAVGVDVSPHAIRDARRNAMRNGIRNASFVCAPAESAMPEIFSDHSPGVVFLDPPRKGCGPELVGAIIAAKIPRVVYISCEPATLARDVAALRAGGYRLEKAAPVDMFPFTSKVETSCLLVRG